MVDGWTMTFERAMFIPDVKLLSKEQRLYPTDVAMAFVGAKTMTEG